MPANTTGIYTTTKKDGSIWYRVSITYKNKHISLGGFASYAAASASYNEARHVLYDDKTYACLQQNPLSPMQPTLNYNPNSPLAFHKWIVLINYRDNDIYIKTPIYLYKKYFLYFLSPKRVLKFDITDLFYYSNHTILARNGYLFVNDYGMQTNILSRYGIRNHSVCGRDYVFVNGDPDDFRYGNLRIINRYYGVQTFTKDGKTLYKVKIHLAGDYVVGIYENENEAAIAYNKAAQILRDKGLGRNYTSNYIEGISKIEYAKIYASIKISKRIREIE